MAVLKGLLPARVFEIFEELCTIPHGSGNTRGISDYCVRFARERGLECTQDASNNIVMVRSAAPGYENAETVILQGHLDMVCEKAAECTKDMETEGLDLCVEGDRVFARGTTLGGDDGIAVAMALAVLEDESLPHPRLEAVFTTEEETGMDGALALDMSGLQGRRLINIDSEAEGVLTVSCAGGVMARCELPVARVPYGGAVLAVTVGGLAGGHSGAEIHKGRGNANTLLGRVLYAMSQACGLRLVSAAGGLKDNAIPRASTALVSVDDTAAAYAAIGAMDAALKNELRTADPGVFVKAEDSRTALLPMDEFSTARAVCLLCCVPNGVQSMSADIAGLVQTSLNLGILETEEAAVTASFCIRSSVATEKEMLKDRLSCLLDQLDGTVSFSGDYPAWEYHPDSVLRQLMIEVYRDQYAEEPRVEAIHAGLECGLFCGKLPELDCVSIGPDLTDIHTPREAMSIASVQRVWKYLLEVLRRCR